MKKIEVYQDPYNPRKAWLVKMYRCHHYYVSQSINGRQIYPYERWTKKRVQEFVPGYEGM